MYAQKVAEWGRRRWTMENSFKTQKSKGEDGFGLEHTFCNDENASRAMHLLMQFAHNLWQVFNSGMLRRLARGCRKVTQSIWARKLYEALHNIDFSGYEPETVYLSREYELECLTERLCEVARPPLVKRRDSNPTRWSGRFALPKTTLCALCGLCER